MARSLTAGMVTGLEAGTILPVLIGRLDILSDPITAWTGHGVFSPTGSGDTALDGQVFVSIAPFIELSDILEDQGIGGPVTLTISGHDLDEDALRQVVRDKRQWRLRNAWLWLGLLNVDEATVIADPVRIKTGIMIQMTVDRRPDGASVTVTVDRDLGNARSGSFRWVDHTRLFPADTWSTFVVELANKPTGFELPEMTILPPGRDPGPPQILD